MSISTKGSASSRGATLPAFTEHRVPHAGGSLYVRDFPGSGPAFVLLHGFPDNLHIYDDLIPHLAAAGRRAVAFDFLGFGASDKPEGAAYTFERGRRHCSHHACERMVVRAPAEQLAIEVELLRRFDRRPHDQPGPRALHGQADGRLSLISNPDEITKLILEAAGQQA